MDKKQPVYTVIYQTLQEKIFAGELKPGDILPSENELCSVYNVSRETVRNGLKQLKTEGLIYVRPRRGYFVSNPQHNEYRLHLDEEVSDNGKYKSVYVERPDPVVQQKLNLAQGQQVICMCRVSKKEPASMNLDVKYLPYSRGYPTIESEIRFAVFPEMMAGKVMQFDFFTKLEIYATAATGMVREHLGCEEGTPLLVIERQFITRENKPVGLQRNYISNSEQRPVHGISGYYENLPDGKLQV